MESPVRGRWRSDRPPSSAGPSRGRGASRAAASAPHGVAGPGTGPPGWPSPRGGSSLSRTRSPDAPTRPHLAPIVRPNAPMNLPCTRTHPTRARTHTRKTCSYQVSGVYCTLAVLCACVRVCVRSCVRACVHMVRATTRLSPCGQGAGGASAGRRPPLDWRQTCTASSGGAP